MDGTQSEWAELFKAASLFYGQALDDADTRYLLRNLAVQFPSLIHPEDLESFGHPKEILVMGRTQRLSVYLALIYFAYSKECRDKVFLFSYEHRKDMSTELQVKISATNIPVDEFVENLRVKFMLLKREEKKANLEVLNSSPSSPPSKTQNEERNLVFTVDALDAITKTSSWQAVKLAITKTLRSSARTSVVGTFIAENKWKEADEASSKLTKYVNDNAVTQLQTKLCKHFPLLEQKEGAVSILLSKAIRDWELIISSRAEQLASVTAALTDFISVIFIKNEMSLQTFMEEVSRRWIKLDRERKHLDYSPEYLLPWQVDYAPLISNLPLLGHDDLAQNFRARINDAGNDSVAARRACEFLKDSLTSLAKSEAFTNSYEHSSQVVSRRVTTNEKTNDTGKRLKEVFGKNWKEVCAEMAKKGLRYPKKFSQLSKQSQQEWWKTWNEARGSTGNSKNNPVSH